MGTTSATNWNKLLFQAVTWANVAINATSSPITIIACAGHTASPSGATQDINEIAYTSYVRATPNRDSTSAGFTCSGATTALGQTLSFAAGTGGSGTMTHGSFGKTSSGATEMFYWGTVTPNIVCGNGVTPQWTTTAFLTIAT
jgi:hypothetical protein